MRPFSGISEARRDSARRRWRVEAFPHLPLPAVLTDQVLIVETGQIVDQRPVLGPLPAGFPRPGERKY